MIDQRRDIHIFPAVVSKSDGAWFFGGEAGSAKCGSEEEIYTFPTVVRKGDGALFPSAQTGGAG